jgi:phage terminase large subunit GpA-like protein
MRTTPRTWLSVEGIGRGGAILAGSDPLVAGGARALADETTEEIVVAKSSQVGYTELLNTFIGWVMAEDPSSLLMIQPTVEMAEAWSRNG